MTVSSNMSGASIVMKFLEGVERRDNGGRNLLGVIAVNKDIATSNCGHLQVTFMSGRVSSVISNCETYSTIETLDSPESFIAISGRSTGTTIHVTASIKRTFMFMANLLIDVDGTALDHGTDTVKVVKRVQCISIIQNQGTFIFIVISIKERNR